MIIEWFLGLVGQFWEWAGSLLPDWELPAALTDPGGWIEQFANYGVGAGQWIEWNFAIPVGLLPLGVWAGGIAWKTFRTIWSHVPFVGGAG